MPVTLACQEVQAHSLRLALTSRVGMYRFRFRTDFCSKLYIHTLEERVPANMAACVRRVVGLQSSANCNGTLLQRPARLKHLHSSCTYRHRVVAAANGEAEFMHDSSKYEKLQGVKVW